jgi:type I restriction enzyme, S subunit
MSDTTSTNGWIYKRLEECTSDGVISYGIVQPGSHCDEGVPVLRVNNITNGSLTLDDVLKVAPEIEVKYKRTRLKGGEVLLTLVGSTGQSLVVPNEMKGWNVPRAIAVIRVDENIGANWVNICLQSSHTKHFLDVRANTTVQKTLNLKDVKDIPILLPPKPVRDFIENTEQGFSKKIALNENINKGLEQIAQAIFKSWFVDFEPTKAKIAAREALLAEVPDATPDQIATAEQQAAIQAIAGAGDVIPTEQLQTIADLFANQMVDSEIGEIPYGWEYVSFEKIARLVTKSVNPIKEPEKLWEHYSIPAFDNNKAPSLDIGESIKSNKYRVEPTAILVSKLNPVTKRVWWPDIKDENAAICSTEFMQFVPIQKENRAFLMSLVESEPFQQGILQRVTGSTGSRQRAQPKEVAVLNVVLPTFELLEQFSSIATPIYVTSSKNIGVNESLAALRDLLLPRLLSGEVSEITKELGL